MLGRPAKKLGWIAVLLLLLIRAGLCAAQSQEGIGQLEGEDFTVRGQVSLATVGGRSVAILASGNELNVRRGAALLHLFEGGEIIFCGPMTISLLKSSSGLTLAFGAGQLYLRLPRPILVNLYTPQFVIGLMESLGNEREIGLALDAHGTLSLKAVLGSVTLREQLGEGALVVPEGVEWQIKNGSLRSADVATGACTCSPSVLSARRIPTAMETVAARRSDTVQTLPEKSPETSEEQAREGPPPSAPVPPVAGLASSSPLVAAPKETPYEQPQRDVWQVIMPPLVYMPETLMETGAGAVQPSTESIFPFAEALAMAKELRLQPAMFVGRVIVLPISEPPREVATSSAASRADTSPTVGGAGDQASKRRGGFGARIKSFFRRLFGGSRS